MVSIIAPMRQNIAPLLKILCGNIILTATYAFLTVPNGIINGGVTSFSLSLATLTGLDISVFSNGITLALIISSAFLISAEFCAKSVLSSVLYMGLFTAFHLTGFSIVVHPPIAAVLAGALVGVSYFLCIDADSSTAGFDVVAIAVNRHFPKTNVAINLRIISVLVLLVGAGVLGVLAVLYGLVFTLVETAVLKVLMGVSAAHRAAGQTLIAEEIV